MLKADGEKFFLTKYLAYGRAEEFFLNLTYNNPLTAASTVNR